MPKVGLFFIVNGKTLYDYVEITQAEKYGDFLIGNSSHFDVWSERHEKIYNKPYDYFPRGRVVFNYKENKYIIYADKCIDQEGIKNIIEVFQLEKENFDIESDMHYVCKQCYHDYSE